MWLLSDLLFLSLELQVLDFSDDMLADLLELSYFSLAFPTGFSPEMVPDLELCLLTHFSLLASSAASGS